MTNRLEIFQIGTGFGDGNTWEKKNPIHIYSRVFGQLFLPLTEEGLIRSKVWEVVTE